MHNLNINRFAYGVLILLSSFFIVSCEDDNVGEYKLTGNIENLIPSGSYSISRTTKAGSDGTEYLVVTPTIDDNFEYWGLSIKKVEYYIDDVLTSTINASPFDLVYPVSDMKAGNHTVKTKITICGEECDDVVLEETDDFYVSTKGSVSQPSASIYFDYNAVCKGETLHITPYVIESRSPKGCKITKAEYYWDDKLIATKTDSPFSWDYQVYDDAETSHDLKVNVQYSNDEGYSSSTSFYYSGYTVMKDDEYRYWWTRKLSDNDNEYVNGETVESVAKLYKGKDNKDEISFKLYYDGNLIGESSTFPYEVDYKLENQTAGTHKFKTEWTVKKSGGSSTTSWQEKTIIVIP